jgi:nicotinamidase-related amidase
MATALVVIDVLVGIFTLPVPVDRPDEFLSVVAELLARARLAGAPVVHVQHCGPPGSRFAQGADTRHIHARALPRDGEPIVSKVHPDAFQSTTLEAVLREVEASKLVMCGFATEACVDSTVRSAYARGFSVELASDGHTTTANPILDAKAIIAHHNFVLARFAKVLPHTDIAFDR